MSRFQRLAENERIIREANEDARTYYVVEKRAAYRDASRAG